MKSGIVQCSFKCLKDDDRASEEGKREARHVLKGKTKKRGKRRLKEEREKSRRKRSRQ